MLEILGVHHRDSKNLYMLCKCHCGNETVAIRSAVIAGLRKSCGCTKEQTKEAGIASNKERKENTFNVWSGMVARCHNKNNPNYNHYGGRGIFVCDDWRYNYRKFREDMEERPHGTSLDRIDNNLGYSKGNCRWADNATQHSNMRSNKFYNVFGEVLLLKDIMAKFNLTRRKILYWISKGVSIEDVINRQRETYIAA